MNKEMLTIKEACEYTGFTRSYMYKLLNAKKIPHYKPNGGRVYFDRNELVAWLKRNRISTTDELETQAQSYCMKGGAA